MSVYEAFQTQLAKFIPNHANAPATTFIFGIVTPDEAPFSIKISRDSAVLLPHIKKAEYILYGDSATFIAILNPQTPSRKALCESLRLRPNYPFDQYLISILFKAFMLDMSDLNYDAKPFDEPFPFPPRYPVAENRFRQQVYIPAPLPTDAHNALPQLVADGHPKWVAMYDKAWQIALKNFRQPEAGAGFIANFMDAAFNPNAFLWDGCFMTLFGHYARRHFSVLGTLDNFYAKQHDDGFICREINTYTGTDLFQSLDPRSTGPNIFAWTEWAHHQYQHDTQRLKAVFPALIGYHRWWREWRTHPDESYWTSGWGSGMDNQTRVPNSEYHHRQHTWVDAMMQQALSAQLLQKIGAVVGRDEFDAELEADYAHIESYVNTHLWDEATGFYYDRAPNGGLSQIKTIGAYWGLLCDVIPPKRATRLIAHLRDENGFNRPHPIPTQAYDSPDYNPYGGYWLGGVWSPTNYMVLRGLTRLAQHDLAHEIAHRHVEAVAEVYQQTGTLYENYSPEYPQAGIPARGEFVGWTGLSAITIPIEYLIGLRADVDNHRLVWDIRLTERHGVLRYPFGASNTLNLICEAQSSNNTTRHITIKTEEAITIDFYLGNHHHPLSFEAGEHHISLNFPVSESL